MRKLIILLTLLLNILLYINSSAQNMPLVYDVENTGADCPKPSLLLIDQLPTIQSLPDPFTWADGRGRIFNFSDWRYRRAEISAQIQNYEIGEKPVKPDTITASYSGGILTVIVTVNGKTLTITSQVILPTGSGPFPAVIGVLQSIPSTIFSSRNIAQITFNYNQVTTDGNANNTNPYYRIYPHLNIENTGQYSAWAWGVSRIIDGLELVQNVLPIDLKHIAVSGCSRGGKMALFAGAFDERIALTIAQESGGGGYTTWRYSQQLDQITAPPGVETLGKTDYNWFKDAMRQFSSAVTKLPEDHHELMAMVAPRALLVTGNPSQTWLADESGYVGSKAAKEVWNALGVPDRFGYSIITDHPHCAVPSSQIPEIEAFVEKFLLGNNTVNTNIATTTYNINLSPWITWTTPTLSNGSSFFGKASLIYPANLQTGVDTTNITFRWNKVSDTQKYFFQLSSDPTFTTIDKSDSTATDTLKTIIGLSEGKKYFWRVQVKNNAGYSGPWSDLWNFTTYISLPAVPQLVFATPYPNRPDYIILNWKKVKYASQYLVQLADVQTFTYGVASASTSDTTKIFSGLNKGIKYYWRVQANNVAGSSSWSDVWNFTLNLVGVKEEKMPTEYLINQNYPNPFNPATKFKFALPQRSFTKLIIYDSLGREVQTLVNKELEAGYHEINFDATNLTSGVYCYRIQSGDFIQTKKMILMK